METIEYVKKYVKEQGYQLKNTEIHSEFDTLELICPTGCIYMVRWCYFKLGFRCHCKRKTFDYRMEMDFSKPEGWTEEDIKRLSIPLNKGEK
jgi:hypothetical protein